MIISGSIAQSVEREWLAQHVKTKAAVYKTQLCAAAAAAAVGRWGLC
jgi:hypothetical protein